MYKVDFTKRALISLKKLDEPTAKLLVQWIRNHLEGIENPRSIGKPLQDDLSEKWRYRKGNYRIIAEINDDKILILVVDIGHRKDIYEQF